MHFVVMSFCDPASYTYNKYIPVPVWVVIAWIGPFLILNNPSKVCAKLKILIFSGSCRSTFRTAAPKILPLMSFGAGGLYPDLKMNYAFENIKFRYVDSYIFSIVILLCWFSFFALCVFFCSSCVFFCCSVILSTYSETEMKACLW